MPYYKRQEYGSSKYKGVRKSTFKSFKRPYYKKRHYKHRSTNSATTKTGKFFKTVSLRTFKVSDFFAETKIANPVPHKVWTPGRLVFSTHAPVIAGPIPIVYAGDEKNPNDTTLLMTSYLP